MTVQTIGIDISPNSELGKAFATALGIKPEDPAAPPLPEAIIERMREALPRHQSVDCPYKPGDLVKGRSDAIMPPMFRNGPLMVIEALREPRYSWEASAPMLPDHGKRQTVRCLFHTSNKTFDVIGALWFDHADLEPYDLPTPQPEASAT